MAILLSLNVGTLKPSPAASDRPTGIDKQPVTGPVDVRAPGSKAEGLGSGLVGDQIGDHRHHGGGTQAVYAYAREELDEWEGVLGRPLASGAFGENLTTTGLVVSDAVIGERWRVGAEVVLQVTVPRIPCRTFRAHIDEVGWLKTFTIAARSGTYLSVVAPGTITPGDEITVISRPDHGVLVSQAFRAVTRERELLPGLLAAGDDLEDELREMALSGQTFTVG